MVFQKSAQFPIVQNNVIHTLSYIGREYVIQFEIYLTRVPRQWKQLIDFVRYQPVLWYDGAQFQIQSAISGSDQKKLIPYKMVANTWFNLQISQLENDEGHVRYIYDITFLY